MAATALSYFSGPFIILQYDQGRSAQEPQQLCEMWLVYISCWKSDWAATFITAGL